MGFGNSTLAVFQSIPLYFNPAALKQRKNMPHVDGSSAIAGFPSPS